MVYNQFQIFQRIRATLPRRWFGETTPVLDAVLMSLSAGWSGVFKLLDYARMQTRIGSASEDWLDLISLDYFGTRLPRRLRETDDGFRERISKELLRDRCTRAAIFEVVLSLTGRTPIIFEPTNPRDTGCYNSMASVENGTMAYGITGGWGNLNLPYQAFVRAFRAMPTGITMINGWSGCAGGFGIGLAGYMGSNSDSSWADDAEIFDAVSCTAPATAIIWMSIEP